MEKILAAIKLAHEALQTDGEHHKQWYLEEIVKTLGYTFDTEERIDLEEGIAP